MGNPPKPVEATCILVSRGVPEPGIYPSTSHPAELSLVPVQVRGQSGMKWSIIWVIQIHSTLQFLFFLSIPGLVMYLQHFHMMALGCFSSFLDGNRVQLKVFIVCPWWWFLLGSSTFCPSNTQPWGNVTSGPFYSFPNSSILIKQESTSID